MAKKLKLKKVISVIKRGIIKKENYFSVNKYMKDYTRYLQDLGVNLSGSRRKLKYVDPSAYFDGWDYSLISIGDNVTISREVMLLTHDFSITTAMASLGKIIERGEGEMFFNKGISIGDNTFIGARVSILPETKIGNNCIIGACSVVKGVIPDGSIVVGNPAKIVASTKEFALKHCQLKDYITESNK